MSIRYTPDELHFLRDSPLVVKPPGLPPVEQWMGAPADATARNAAKPQTDRSRNYDSDFTLDQPHKRPAPERHVSRNSANPEDIILGPPKTAFMSATSLRNAGKAFDSGERTPGRELDTRDRFSFRSNRIAEGENDRPRDGRNNNLRVKRNEGDQDSDGWSTVKPRKSFGNEGAERFNGRMGLSDNRPKEDRRFKDREDRDVKDRPARGFDNYSREKENEDQDRDSRRNGTGRGRNEPSWFKDNNDGPPTPNNRNSNGDRFMDRSRGWREKEREDRDDRVVDKYDRGDRRERGDRGDRGDRRWDRDRDQRQEREPEWLAEPEEEKQQAHTQEDFQKWKDQMAGKDKAAKTPAAETPLSAEAGGGFFGFDKPQKVETPLAMDTGPDKFFGKWASPNQDGNTDSGIESRKEGMAKANTTGKASRFTSFFTPQEETQRRQTEPQPPPPMPMPPQGGVEALFQNAPISQAEKAKETLAFQQLLSKLQRTTVNGPTGSTPPISLAQQPKPPAVEKQQPISHSIPVTHGTPEPFQQYRHDEGRQPARNSQQALQDLLAQRQATNSQPTSRPDQMLQELVGQRQNALSQSSVRQDQQPSRNNNTEFLMGLMQSAKAAPDPQRTEQLLLRMPPGQKSSADRDRHIQQQLMEQELQREAAHREAAQRERASAQRQARPPPGFYDDASFQRGPPPQHERQPNNLQPTQILQRPPPPGLDLGWERPAQLQPQHRVAQNIPPPPGLQNGPNRAMPMPQQMFPPGFPMANFPPEMPGPPRNIQMQPPPGFFNAPPPGFMPPGMSGFQGPEGMAFGPPFDGRGPPPGGYRRQ
ncbi:hypothetical protein GLAREA_05082 [Glarea lozoyensis ATCC 20868]|uniref:Uncharacterized protein n=2 Tax=Glarea lozoyensis TaxID=101852 RepID=S3DF64_GLAL2|nr:uncharacterized protein GLAREA_05082 [Glarea lozoyensis ATCC 20868]EHK99611.1 hypothetical protein M7I_4483 [Glarea lozoyensis 74030]EPE35744.1 hypothetical protein GLAREA_05082 [Glarea lozoyensis ATCC 20868]